MTNITTWIVACSLPHSSDDWRKKSGMILAIVWGFVILISYLLFRIECLGKSSKISDQYLCQGRSL